MKKIPVVLIFILCFTLFVSPAYAAAPKVLAKSCVLMEMKSKRVLFMDNGYDLLPMASTTKIMTCILALEKGNLDDYVVVSKKASGVEGSSIWLSAGEKMKLKDMLYGLMLSSGNDAAVAIAEHIARSVEAFAEMMNKKAQEIGAFNTNFTNPNGLHDKNHYTTAYDLALISCYAMENPVFAEIVSTKYKNIPWEGHEYERVVKNKNKILWQYEGGNGIKTGYTKHSGKCLAAAAAREGMQLVAVVINDGNMFEDCMNLLNFGFENYDICNIIDKGEPAGKVDIKEGREKTLEIFAGREICLPLTEEEKTNVAKRVYLDKNIKAPVAKGQAVGRAEVWLEGKKLAMLPLYADKAVEENSYRYNFYKILEKWLRAG